MIRVVVLVLLAGLVAPPAHAQPGTDALLEPGVLVADGLTAPPAPDAGGWLVADLGTGEVLAAQNARVAQAPASVLKVLTALALAPEVPDDTVYTGSFEAAAIDGSKVGIVPDSTYSGRDLLHGLLMSSGNDTAQAITELVGGPAEATAAMQRTADELGATDTVVANASGLDSTGQVASPRDLALLGRALLADERLAPIVATERYRFPDKGNRLGSQRARFEIGNHNRLLGDYPGVVGVKNGYTQQAGASLVVAAEQEGRTVLVVLLRAEGSIWQQSRALLEWAFASAAGAGGLTTLDQSVTSSQRGEPAENAPAAPQPALPPGDGAQRVGAGDDRSMDSYSVAVDRGPAPNAAWVASVVVLLGFAGATAVVLLVLRRTVSGRARSARASTLPGPPHAGR